MSHNDDWLKEEQEQEARKNAARVSAVANASDIVADADRIRDLEAEVARLKRIEAAARALLACIALDEKPRDCECVDALRAAIEGSKTT